MEKKSYYVCPKCSTIVLAKPCEKYRSCTFCKWNESLIKNKREKKSNTESKEAEERIEQTTKMVQMLIPSPMPDILFAEKELESYGFNINRDAFCWAWADPEFNVLRMTGIAYKLHRRQFTDTVAHEVGHLSPNKLVGLEEFIENTKDEEDWTKLRQKTIDKSSTYQPSTRNEAIEYLKDHDFSDNRVPMIFSKKSFEDDPFGAGEGHGYGWYLEYQKYQSVLFGAFGEWMNDPNQNTPSKFAYPTYSSGWMRENTKYKSKEEFMKSYGEADLFGKEIFEDRDEDLRKQYKFQGI